MTKLHCNAVHCEYNSQNLCCRPDIHVGGGHEAKSPKETCCDSFRERLANAKNQTAYDCPSETLKVSCSAASCRYNNQGKCVANAIQIGGATANRSRDTECDTFTCGSKTACG